MKKERLWTSSLKSRGTDHRGRLEWEDLVWKLLPYREDDLCSLYPREWTYCPDSTFFCNKRIGWKKKIVKHHSCLKKGETAEWEYIRSFCVNSWTYSRPPNNPLRDTHTQSTWHSPDIYHPDHQMWPDPWHQSFRPTGICLILGLRMQDYSQKCFFFLT